jgi:Protein of unknown function (DUF2800)
MTGTLEILDAFEAKIADAFPLGQQGAEVLDQLERVTKLCTELKEFYKRQLGQDPDCVPGWTLRPGAVRRSLANAQGVWEKLRDSLSVEQFMVAVKLEVGRLQDQWARVNGIAPTKAKEEFNAVLGDLVIELQNVPSLVRIK